MLKISYGSFGYFLPIFLAIGLCVGAFFALKNRQEKVKRSVILILSLVNFLQHIFKALIFPHYYGNFSLHLSSAYNVCAFLILVTPFILLFGNELLQNYLAYVGSVAGMIAMLVPYWFQEPTAISEVIRFYLCHTLLFLTSILPILLKLYKLRWKHFWKMGLLFFLMLGIIILNDIIFISIGSYPVSNPNDLYGSLVEINPCWSIAPPENGNFGWLIKIISFFTPSVLMGNNPASIYIPILWYAIPMYIGITLVATIVCILVDYRQFKKDFATFKAK